ncbi:hypothetical protein [Neptuniibacter sp.]|nr:hypothetical protein [Neptuniibacter sp.]
MLSYAPEEDGEPKSDLVIEHPVIVDEVNRQSQIDNTDIFLV